MQGLLKKFEESNTAEQLFERGKDLNEFVRVLGKEEPETIF
jgi:hypothetical protein